MQNILLFSRCRLTELYGGITKHLNSENNIIHLAYSEQEEYILTGQYNILNVINFKEKIKMILATEKIDFELCNKIDQDIIHYTNGRFNLNSSLQNDRTYQFLEYGECLLLSQVYYKFWDNLIVDYNIDILFHEPPALFFTHISAILCKKHEIKYISLNPVLGPEKFNWMFIQGDNAFSCELSKKIHTPILKEDDLLKAKEFIRSYRNESQNFFSQLNKITNTSYDISFYKFIFSLLKTTAKHFLNSIKKNNEFELINHVEQYSKKNSPKLLDELKKRWDFYFNIKYDDYSSGLNYYYYPLHLEPEAVVLYYAEGIYKNQVKLIENIAAGLPSNHYLYVKDHPHGGTYRDFIDFTRIQAVPNIKLLNPAVSSKQIISHCKGVITINGTSGFEAILQKKQVFTFGNIFYALFPKVIQITNIKEFREEVYNNFNSDTTEEELIHFISQYLNSIHKGFVSYFGDYPEKSNINNQKNFKLVSMGITDILQSEI
jgi:hypothetical protein